MNNPFFYGSIVEPTQFLNRRKPLRRTISRILNQGQSTAIVGEPRMGKSSLLDYLIFPQNLKDLYGKDADRFFFNLIDVQMLGGQISQAQFWEKALEPIAQGIIQQNPGTSLAQHYEICQQNHFGTFTLEKFLKQLRQDDWRLILLLDEFDLLLHHPVLNSAEFFGSLRALASRSRGALAVVTASRQSLTTLNIDTQEFNPTGSPYFNIFAEVNLESFTNKDIEKLLNRAGSHFSVEDKKFIKLVAGGHPYLLQVAASAMWEEKNNESPQEYHLAVGKRLYRETKFHFSDTWQFWAPEIRKAVTAIALIQVPDLLDTRDFLTSEFIHSLPDFAPEIDYLKTIGLVIQDEQVLGEYRITQAALLFWLTDELLRIVRDDTPFEQWVERQQFVGLLTKNEINHMSKAAQFVNGLLQHGATTLIEALAKSVFG